MHAFAKRSLPFVLVLSTFASASIVGCSEEAPPPRDAVTEPTATLSPSPVTPPPPASSEDAAKPPAPEPPPVPADAGPKACADRPQLGAEVRITVDASVAPVPSGGPVPDGVYVRTAAVLHTTEATSPGSATLSASTWEIRGTRVAIANGSKVMTADVSLSENTLTLTSTCVGSVGQVGQASSFLYSVTADRALLLIKPNGAGTSTLVETFEKRN